MRKKNMIEDKREPQVGDIIEINADCPICPGEQALIVSSEDKYTKLMRVWIRNSCLQHLLRRHEFIFIGVLAWGTSPQSPPIEEFNR